MLRSFSSIPLRRVFVITCAALSLSALAGCEEDPLVGDDVKVLHRSPGYVYQAYVYKDRDPAADAERAFAASDYRLYALVSFGAHYPGCKPGVGEKYAARYGTVIMPKTAGEVEIDAQEWYRDIAWNYAGNYNQQMVTLIEERGTSTVTQRTTVVRDK